MRFFSRDRAISFLTCSLLVSGLHAHSAPSKGSNRAAAEAAKKTLNGPSASCRKIEEKYLRDYKTVTARLEKELPGLKKALGQEIKDLERSGTLLTLKSLKVQQPDPIDEEKAFGDVLESYLEATAPFRKLIDEAQASLHKRVASATCPPNFSREPLSAEDALALIHDEGGRPCTNKTFLAHHKKAFESDSWELLEDAQAVFEGANERSVYASFARKSYADKYLGRAEGDIRACAQVTATEKARSEEGNEASFNHAICLGFDLKTSDNKKGLRISRFYATKGNKPIQVFADFKGFALLKSRATQDKEAEACLAPTAGF